MKAFKKWFNRSQRIEVRSADLVKGREVRSCEAGWRAALEWLRDNEDAHCCGDSDAVGDWTECPKDTAIKQELV